MNVGYDTRLEDFKPNTEYQFEEYHDGLRYYIPGITIFQDDLIPANVEL